MAPLVLLVWVELPPLLESPPDEPEFWLDRFPLFRPVRELYEDAKAMDGFIPSMYQKAKDLDNEDKQ